MRLFEVTGCGSCIVTDARPGIEKLFAPDAEIVTYRSKDDLGEKVGEVGQLAVTPETGRPTRLTLRQGRIFKQETELFVDSQRVIIRTRAVWVAKASLSP